MVILRFEYNLGDPADKCRSASFTVGRKGIFTGAFLPSERWVPAFARTTAVSNNYGYTASLSAVFTVGRKRIWEHKVVMTHLVTPSSSSRKRGPILLLASCFKKNIPILIQSDIF